MSHHLRRIGIILDKVGCLHAVVAGLDVAPTPGACQSTDLLDGQAIARSEGQPYWRDGLVHGAGVRSARGWLASSIAILSSSRSHSISAAPSFAFSRSLQLAAARHRGRSRPPVRSRSTALV